MATNDVSFLSFSVKPQNEKKADEQEKIKAEVIKKLESTPVTYGMGDDIPETSSAVSIPIGQTKPPIDRFSPEGLANAIEGFDEVSNDSDVKNALALSKWNPANWFKSDKADKADTAGDIEQSNEGVHDLTDAGLPSLTQEALDDMSATDDEIAAYLNNSEFSKTSQLQGTKSDNREISTEERGSAMNEMAKLATEHFNLTKILSDPNATDAQKADAKKKLEDISAKASKLFENTPLAQTDKPELNPEVQNQVDNLNKEDKAATQKYLQGAVGKGADSDDAGFKKLSPAAQGAVTAMAGDLKVKNPDLD